MCNPTNSLDQASVATDKMRGHLLKMSRYLCGSSTPCEKHIKQAKDLWLIAAEGFPVTEAPPTIAPVTAPVPIASIINCGPSADTSASRCFSRRICGFQKKYRRRVCSIVAACWLRSTSSGGVLTPRQRGVRSTGSVRRLGRF